MILYVIGDDQKAAGVRKSNKLTQKYTEKARRETEEKGRMGERLKERIKICKRLNHRDMQD